MDTSAFIARMTDVRNCVFDGGWRSRASSISGSNGMMKLKRNESVPLAGSEGMPLDEPENMATETTVTVNSGEVFQRKHCTLVFVAISL